jgi:hypothetical protein
MDPVPIDAALLLEVQAEITANNTSNSEVEKVCRGIGDELVYDMTIPWESLHCEIGYARLAFPELMRIQPDGKDERSLSTVLRYAGLGNDHA